MKNDLKLEIQTVNQRAYERIRELIVTGELTWGTRLDERILAERLGISRTPVREAIVRLGNEEVIERRPYQGNVVRSFTQSQIVNLFDVRAEMEALAVRRAAEYGSAADFDVLEDIVRQCHAALHAGDLVEFEKRDQEFHQQIAAISRNETLIQCLNRLGLQIQLARHRANLLLDFPMSTIEDREQILAGLRKGDGAAAEQVMRRHIDRSRNSALRGSVEPAN